MSQVRLLPSPGMSLRAGNKAQKVDLVSSHGCPFHIITTSKVIKKIVT